MHAVFSNADIERAIDSLPDGVEFATIWNWTRHHAHAYVRYQKGQTRPELPAEVASRALDVRPVIDDETVHWTHYAQRLKATLDPNASLGVGP